jgi:flagellar biosynthesis/type III secretory pathway protein FliH
MRAPGAGVREVQLIRHLYTRGWTRQQILDLFRFLDWVLTLPEALEQQFQVALAQVEAETHMPYITSIERMGIEKGIQQGWQEGRQQGLQEGFQQGEVFVLTHLLTRRFGPLPDWATERLTQASREESEQWTERVLEAQRLEDIFATS